jgi:shikimate kinase
MATPVNSRQPLKENAPTRGLVIEIIGPAGAGKSTLYRALGECDARFVREPLPPVRDISYFLFFVKNIIALIPTLVSMQGKTSRRLTREELAWMAMLNGWPELLKRQTRDSRKIILLDQGPIFLIGTLQGFGPPGLQNPGVQAWWNKIYARWTEVLDTIVWLDAADELLTMRIRTREQEHLVKEALDQKVHDFLAEWRQVYDRVMDRISLDNARMQILRVDTGRFTAEEIVSQVISSIDR